MNPMTGQVGVEYEHDPPGDAVGDIAYVVLKSEVGHPFGRDWEREVVHLGESAREIADDLDIRQAGETHGVVVGLDGVKL